MLIAKKRLMTERLRWRTSRDVRTNGMSAKFATTQDGGQDVLLWKCKIPGKNGGLWEGAEIKFDLVFTEDYPGKPPKAKTEFIDGKPLFHPNIAPSGTVCLSILDEDADWKPHITIQQILLGIQELLDEPNFRSAIQSVPQTTYLKDPNEYRRRVREQAAKSKPTDGPVICGRSGAKRVRDKRTSTH